MHRRKYAWGCACAAFGFGFLIGMWVEGGFLSHCIGFGLLICGLSQICRRQT